MIARDAPSPFGSRVGVAQMHFNLTFHGIGTPPPGTSPSEEAVWLTASAFESILDAVRSEDHVRITFDDGNRSDYEVALSALVERGMKARFFVLAGKLADDRYLDAGQLREIVSAGMTIGLHGMDHRGWRGLSDAEATREMEDARATLEDVIASPVMEAACPFGAYDRQVLKRLRACGFESVYTSDRLPVRAGAWFQPRFTLHGGDGPESVRSWIDGPSALAIGIQRVKVFLKQNRP